jgi:transcriptional regulator with XRE-family HTH domain
VETIHTKRHAKLVEALIEARKAAGIRQAELARLVGKTQTFVARFESGERRIDLVEAAALCEIYGVDPRKMFREVLKIENELWQSPNRRRPK